MSLYRQAGGRPWAWIALALIIGSAIGLGIGLLVGGGGDDEPTLAEQIADLRGEARPIGLALEQVPIEYSGTVKNGSVSSPTEYQAAQATVARATAAFDQLRPDLEALDPAATERLDRALAELGGLVDAKASEAEVEAQATAAEQALAAAVGAPPPPGS